MRERTYFYVRERKGETGVSTANELHLTEYTQHLESANRSKNTITSYTYTLDRWSEWLDHGDYMDATKSELRDFFAHGLTEVRESSVAVDYRNLRAFYNWAVREELIATSPMTGVKPPKVNDIPPDLATDEELAALLKTCDSKSFLDLRDELIIRIWCEPGAPRRAEVTDILLDNVDIRNRKILYKGKGGKWRTLFYGHKTATAMTRYLRARAKHKLAHLPHLYLGERGKQLTMWGLKPMLERRCRAAGIRVLRPHQIRHTTYHAYRMAGGSADDAEVLFGWSPNSRMDQVYGRSMKLARAEQSARKVSIADRF